MKLTLRQLQIFSAIVKTGSTSAAAAYLSLSQSAVSAALSELEHSIGNPLFDRAGRKLQLNDKGRGLLPMVLNLLDNANRLEEACIGQTHSVLRIGASLTIGNYTLPKLLRHYFETLGLQLGDETPPLQITVASTGDVTQQVAGFEVDIGLVEGSCHAAEITVNRWLPDELLIVAAPGHPVVRAFGDQPAPVSRLSNSNWLLREKGSGTREILELLLLPQLGKLNSTIEFNDHEAIKNAAAAGLGIACLSRWVVQDMLDSGRLVVIRSQLAPIERNFSILVHDRKTITPGMQQFLSFLQQGHLQQQ